jgi:hypothetical protein
MAKAGKEFMIPDELVINRIYLIRGQKVMLDRDLSELYGVSTKVFKQAARRNIDRFPDDFMFEMTREELENWRSQFEKSLALSSSPMAATPLIPMDLMQ